jgi:hypothetical protein
MEGPTSRKTNEPPKRASHKGKHQVLEPLPVTRSISNKERRGTFEFIYRRVELGANHRK